MKLFVEDLKGYVEVFKNVSNIKIIKRDKKNILVIHTKNNYNLMGFTIPLSEIRLCYMIDPITLNEYFRYEK